MKEILNWTKDYFAQAGIEKARLEAEQLLAHVLDTDRLKLYLNPERPLEQQELEEFRPLIKRRKTGEPIQYITGHSNFMGLTLQIDERALIPRPETEEMTEEILSRFRQYEKLKVLDLGTGSGAIAIALARFLVDPKILAVDKSSGALELAKRNAASHNLREKIEFRLSNWFSDIEGKFNLIVSNPPYVAKDELDKLDEKIKDHEPSEALNGGEEGLEEIKHILEQAESYLAEKGSIFLEIGYDQGKKVRDYALTQNLKDVTLIKDAGGKERLIHGRKG